MFIDCDISKNEDTMFSTGQDHTCFHDVLQSCQPACTRERQESRKEMAASEGRNRDLLIGWSRFPKEHALQRQAVTAISCVCKKILLRRLDHWTTAAFC